MWDSTTKHKKNIPILSKGYYIVPLKVSGLIQKHTYLQWSWSSCRGISRRLQTRGPSESLILAKLKNGTVTLVPLKFSSLEPLGPPVHPCLCLNGALFVMLIYLFLSFSSIFFPSFSFPFLSFFFFFWCPFSNPGAEAPKAPQDTPLSCGIGMERFSEIVDNSQTMTWNMIYITVYFHVTDHKRTWIMFLYVAWP